MHFSLFVIAIIVVLCGGTIADNCNPETIFELKGNTYCTAVDAIRYENVGTPGFYNQIVDMRPDGVCSSVPKAFSGPLSPLDEEVSLHFRGPLHLKQLAVYKLKGVQERGLSLAPSRVHGHRRFHKRYDELEAVKETTGDDLANENTEDRSKFVHEALDGVLYTLINWWFKPGQLPKSTPMSTLVRATTSTVAKPTTNFLETPKPVETTAWNVAEPIATISAVPRPGGTTGDFSRIGYYDSSTQHLDGLTFLGNHGGQGSGAFDMIYGSSLSYLSADGTSGASSPQILADNVIGSATEYTIMTDVVCNGDCGFVRPGSVAYHGFEGADKVFLIEFQMPFDGNTGFQGDAPAIWMLNAQIPRTMQYGNETCSCWDSGCGELDIVEVLTSGLIQCKSTIHTNKPAGDSDYITRPTDNFMKLAVVFRSTTYTAHIQVLDNNFVFGTSLTSTQVNNICTSTQGKLLSVFHITA